MPYVLLGNPDPTAAGAASGSVVEVDVPWSKSLTDAVADISADGEGHLSGLWRQHSRAAAPLWLESDSPELAAALSAKWGCPVGRPAA